MKLLATFFFCLTILFCGCSAQKDNIKNTFTGKEITKYVLDAVNGNEQANVKLSNLYDYALPLPLKANSVLVDSIRTGSGETIYLVLIEHENPFYNRLAIYNNKLQLLLLDKSLNGYLSFSPAKLDGKDIIRVNENFTSKDTLELQRLSFYTIEDAKAELCFRSFVKLVRNNKEFKQNIDEVSGDTIKTTITAPAGFSLKNKKDIFVFDEATNRFSSSSDTFNKFVIEDIRNFSTNVKKPQITDVKSAMLSIGFNSNTGPDTLLNTSNYGVDGFGLTLSETWKELRNVSISSYINKELKGTRYINNNFGASIYIIPLGAEDSAEVYINTVLNQKSEGKYKVRYADKIESGKNFIQYFEYSCGSKKYLLILETSKYTYEKYKQVYSDIISTFYMEC